MKPKEITQRIERIKQESDDPERAHEMEDSLFVEFIEAIQNGSYDNLEEVVNAAKEVIKVKDLDSPRWCA